MCAKQLLSALLLGFCSMNAAEPAAAIGVGKPFPNIVLPTLNEGRPMSIADFRGKKVLLHIFASW
jgi:hypothetical protein